MTFLVATLAAVSAGSIGGQETFDTMLKKYRDAMSIQGTIEFVQSGQAGDLYAESLISSNVAAKKPNLFAILQQKRSGQQTSFQAACDGKQMAYNSPPEWRRSGRNVIYQAAPVTIEGGLDAFATLLLDRQLPVALALYNTYDVNAYSRAIRSVRAEGEEEVNGETLVKLSASYGFSRFGPGNPSKRGGVDAWIPITIWVTKENDLRGIEYSETLQFSQPNGLNLTLKVVNSWRVNLKVNTPVDDSVFRTG